jgi:hypothetical protein
MITGGGASLGALPRTPLVGELVLVPYREHHWSWCPAESTTGGGASLGALPRAGQDAFQVGGEAVFQVTGRNAFQVTAPAFQVAGEEEALQVEEVVHGAAGAQLAAGWQEVWLTGRLLKY